MMHSSHSLGHGFNGKWLFPPISKCSRATELTLSPYRLLSHIEITYRSEKGENYDTSPEHTASLWLCTIPEPISVESKIALGRRLGCREGKLLMVSVNAAAHTPTELARLISAARLGRRKQAAACAIQFAFLMSERPTVARR